MQQTPYPAAQLPDEDPLKIEDEKFVRLYPQNSLV